MNPVNVVYCGVVVRLGVFISFFSSSGESNKSTLHAAAGKIQNKKPSGPGRLYINGQQMESGCS
jgi:hypothetical protein